MSGEPEAASPIRRIRGTFRLRRRHGVVDQITVQLDSPRSDELGDRKRRWRMRLTEHPFGIQTDSTAAAMPNSEAVANGKHISFGKRMFERIERRIWPTGISTLFVTLGLLYTFRWGPDVGHVPSLWIEPSDLAQTFRAAAELAHGHLSSIYQAGPAGTFVDYPGVLIALAPLGALSNVFHGSAVAIIANHLLLAHRSVIPIYPGSQLAESGISPEGVTYVNHDQAFIGLDIVAMMLSCMALFACDALTQRLQVSQPRRIVVCAVVAVLLWNVTVLFGHPEDAVAVAFAVYAFVFALNGRFAGAGWLFGVALMFQPLVLLMLPVLLAMAGRRYALGMTISIRSHCRSPCPFHTRRQRPSDTSSADRSADFSQCQSLDALDRLVAASQWRTCRRRSCTNLGLAFCHRPRRLGLPAMARTPRTLGLVMFPSPGFARVHGVRDDSILRVGGHGGWRGGGGPMQRSPIRDRHRCWPLPRRSSLSGGLAGSLGGPSK